MRKDHGSGHKHNHHLITEEERFSAKHSSSPQPNDHYRKKHRHKKSKYKDEEAAYHSENSNPDPSVLTNEAVETSDSDDDSNSYEQRKRHKRCGHLSNTDRHRKRQKSESGSPEADEERHKHRSSRKDDRCRKNVPENDIEAYRPRKRKDHEDRWDSSKKSRSDHVKIKQEPDQQNGMERVRIKTEPRDEEEAEEERRRELSDRKFRVKEEPRDSRSRSRPVHGNDRQRPSGSGNFRGRDRKPSRDREEHEWGGGRREKNSDGKKVKKETEKPNFKLSGKLAEDTNVYKGVVIKYSEPPEARMPKKRWRLYPFKGEEAMPTLYIHRQSAYLLGRDRKIADIPVDHPSCSKQHAVLQYRLITFERPDGSVGKQIRLYVIDLESANGTFLNNNKIEPKKYVELREKDVLKFGFSSREYVLLHEHSKDDNSEEEQ